MSRPGMGRWRFRPRLAVSATSEQTLRRLEAVLATSQSLADNPGLVPLLAVESLTPALRRV